METEPFQLFDRIDPDDRNDDEEVSRFAGALDKVENRPPGATRPADLGERTKAFQSTRGLKPDGLVNERGPTFQKVAAELHEKTRKTTEPHRKLLGRGANLPLWGSVGRGESNLPGDLHSTARGLALTGHLPTRTALRPRDEWQEEDARDITPAIERLQRQHGLKVDGVMTPFGPTHERMDHLLGPRLAELAGPDMRAPKTPEPRRHKQPVRSDPFVPTRFFTPFVDPPDREEERREVEVAHGLAADIRRDMDFELQARATDQAAPAIDSRTEVGIKAEQVSRNGLPRSIVRDLAVARIDELAKQEDWSDEVRQSVRLQLDEHLPAEQEDDESVEVAAAPAIAAVPAAANWLWALLFGGSAVGAGAIAADQLRKNEVDGNDESASPNRNEARKHGNRDDNEEGDNRREKRRGKVASDSGKNEPHGDAKAIEKAQPQVDEIEKRIQDAPTKKEKKKLKVKKRNIAKTAQKRAKGEHHGERGKKNR